MRGKRKPVEVQKKIDWLLQQEYIRQKYYRPGIYCIKVNGTIVYAGKSECMLERLAAHMYLIEQGTESNKYKVLNQAQQEGCQITFDVLFGYPSFSCSKEELGKLEGEYIRKYLPPLNYQIPKEDGKHFNTQSLAKSITWTQLKEYCRITREGEEEK